MRRCFWRNSRRPCSPPIDRRAQSCLAILGAEVVVMDDGFQNPSLRKDLALVVVDGARGVGNGFVLPAGPLRAPLAVQIRMADALVVLGEGSGRNGVRIAARAGRPTLRAHTEPTRRRGSEAPALPGFRRHRRPDASSTPRSPRPVGSIGHTMDFPDHHLFTDADCEAILAEAKSREPRPDHDREGPRAPQPSRRCGRAAGSGDGDISGARPLRRAETSGDADPPTRLPRTAAPTGASRSFRAAERQFPLERGGCVDIGLLPVDAPIAEFGERNAPGR